MSLTETLPALPRSTSEFSATSTLVESESNLQKTKLRKRDSSSDENVKNAKRFCKNPSKSTVTIAGQELEPTVVYDTFWVWISERMSIYEKRQLHVPQK